MEMEREKKKEADSYYLLRMVEMGEVISWKVGRNGSELGGPNPHLVYV